jgi:uncharacterized repeat protein (TIGR03803 family)
MVYQLDPSGSLVVLHSFNGRTLPPSAEAYDGQYPLTALVQAADGSFYGTTDAAYPFSWTSVVNPGTLFRLDSAGDFSTIHAFRCIDGADPSVALTQATDGSFYGTTYKGGASDLGTAFRLGFPAGEMITLHTFDGTDGAYPGRVIQATDGNFYGPTAATGATGGGSLFRMDAVGEITTLYRFPGYSGGDEGVGPEELIQATDGFFYGTTGGGGYYSGTAFRLDGAGTLTYLCHFGDSGLAGPGPLIQVGDRFYGIADSFNNSKLFEMDITGVVTQLHYFFWNDEGEAVSNKLVVADSDLFGTLLNGYTSSKGGVFKTSTDTDDLQVIHSFDGTDGDSPFGPLVATTDQWLYGTTYQGGEHGRGTVFRMDYDGQSFTLIHSFSGISGANSTAGLIQAADGLVYGTAGGGPFGGHGVIFRLSNAQIAVNEVAPSSGVGEAGVAMTVLGGGFAPGVTVTIGGVAATNVTVVDSTFLHLLMPALSPGTYDVTVTAPGGAASATLPAAFVVSDTGPPTITGFSPTSGFPGTAVTINGSGFTGATAVAFNGVAATSFTINSNISITATAPPGATTGELSVTTPGGTAFSATDFTVWTLSITSFTPTTGPVNTTVTINGTGFTGVSSVKFNGVAAASFNVLSSTQLTARVSSAATSGKITVKTPVGTATSATDFIVIFKPTVTGFTPGSGVPGTTVVITGTNFDTASAVAFNGVVWVGATFTINSPTQITATVPSTATTGKIKVTNPAGVAYSVGAFVVPPTITSFSPTSGLAGTHVIINGTTFLHASSVTFNGVAATFTINSYTKITATVPSGATSGKIAVTTPSGTATSATNFMLLPTITSFTPTTGPVNTTVTINGTGFTGVSSVKFNGVAAGSFNVLSLTQLTARVSAAATSGKITVTTLAGTATSATDFIRIFRPTVTGFTPGSGVPGTTVVITGTNFDTASAVAFNTASTTIFTINSPTKITVNVPSAATTGKIKVTNPAGAGSSVGTFLVPPTITSFSPTSGHAGTSVTINGKTFNNASSVTINGVAATFTVTNSTRITATVPSGATSGKIAVTTPGGTATSATNFTVLP